MQADPASEAVQRGLEQLAEVLADLVGRPDEVTLVVPVGLAEAVMRRQPNTDYRTDREQERWRRARRGFPTGASR
jgi:hypothetical protein